MHSGCHTGKSSHTFALTSRCDNDCFFIRVIFELFDIDQRIIRNIDITKLCGCINDIDHAASFDNNLTSVFISGIDDLLHTIHIGCKCRNDQSCIGMLRENIVKCHTDCSLRRGKARSFRICAVAHQCQNAFLSKLRKTLQINGIPEYRCVIHFKITCMHDNSRR